MQCGDSHFTFSLSLVLIGQVEDDAQLYTFTYDIQWLRTIWDNEVSLSSVKRFIRFVEKIQQQYQLCLTKPGFYSL